MWPTSVIFLSVVAFSIVVRGTSLIDVLNQSGASQFAALITSDPNISAIYFSSSVQTVFAPIDGSLLSRKLKRQSSTTSERLALFHGIQQTNTLGSMSIGSGKSLLTNDKTSNLNGHAQSVVTNPSNSTGSNVARRWNTPNWSTTTVWETLTKWSTLTPQPHNYTFTTILPPPPPETRTIYSILRPPPSHNYTLTTTVTLPPPPPQTHIIYSTIPPPLPETITIYSNLPPPPPETATVYSNLPPPPPETVTIYSNLPPSPPGTVTVYSNLPPPPPETVTIYSNLPPSPPGTVTVYSNLPPPPPETVTIYSTLPAPSPTINPPSLLKIYSGLGNNVNIIQANIPYDGGLIHIVDGYFTLPALISETAIADNHTTFTDLAASANLTSTIDNTPAVTCFIPTNAAFAEPNSTSSYDTTASLLFGHIIPDFIGYLPSLTNGATFTTQGGTNITVTVTGGVFYINNAKIIASNLIVDNGVCHVLDSVIIPTAIPPAPFVGDASPSVKGGAKTLALWSFALCLAATLLM